jgi:hypothetical protein
VSRGRRIYATVNGVHVKSAVLARAIHDWETQIRDLREHNAQLHRIAEQASRSEAQTRARNEQLAARVALCEEVIVRARDQIGALLASRWVTIGCRFGLIRRAPATSILLRGSSIEIAPDIHAGTGAGSPGAAPPVAEGSSGP